MQQTQRIAIAGQTQARNQSQLDFQLGVLTSENDASRAVLSMGNVNQLNPEDLSREDANATMPYLEQLPYVGFKPTVPVNDAGCLIEPPVSVPIVAGVNFAAKADAEPPEEPPGTKSLSIGLITFPK